MSTLRKIGRKIVPEPLRPAALRIYEVLSIIASAPRILTKIHLSKHTPLYPAEDFSGGPIVLCNNALSWGGVERQVVNTMRGLGGSTDKKLLLLCLHLGKDAEHDFYLPKLQSFEVRNVVSVQDTAEKLNARIDPQAMRRIRRVLVTMPDDIAVAILRFVVDFIALKPSVVHAWQDEMSICAGFAAKLVGVPKIIISSRNMAARHFGYHRSYMRRSYRELAACPDIVMLNNSEAGALDYASWLKISPSRYRVVRNGVDSSMIKAPEPSATTALRESLGLRPGQPVVGSIFRFFPEKRPERWAQAATYIAKQAPQCHFVVFGDGPLRAKLFAIAAQAGFADRLHLPGPIADAGLGLSCFDVFLLTSSFEGTPNVVLEASILGIPVVASDAGGTRETIDEGRTGHVVYDSTPEKLASAVLQVLADQNFRAGCRRNAPDFIEKRFGLQRMLDETLELYKS